MVSFSRAFDIILEELKNRGITANEFAKKSDVSAAALSNFRQGKAQVNTGTLERMIDALPDDLRDEFFQLLQYPGREDNGLGSPLERAAIFLEQASDEEYLGFAMAMLVEVFSYARRAVKAESDKGFYMTAIEELIAKLDEKGLPSLLETVASTFRRSTIKGKSKSEG